MTQQDSSVVTWIDSFDRGSKAVQFYGGATVGMRTLLDALIPAIQAAKDIISTQGDRGDLVTHATSAASEAAEKGAEGTKSMRALAGRTSYIASDIVKLHSDPGAVAVAIIIRSIAQCFAENSV